MAKNPTTPEGWRDYWANRRRGTRQILEILNQPVDLEPFYRLLEEPTEGRESPPDPSNGATSA